MQLDLTDPAFLTDPDETLSRLRAEGGLVRTRIPLIGQVWLTTTDAGARALLKSPDLFVRDFGTVGGKPLSAKFWWLPGFMKPLLAGILGQDGADHTRLRGMVDSAFARSSIDDLRPKLRSIADTLLDSADPAKPCDIVSRYARPLPLTAICTLLGVPEEDQGKVAHWVSPVSGPVTPWGIARALPGLWRLTRYFRADFSAQRAAPRPGLIGDLVQVRDGTDRLSDDELLAMVVVLFIAGHETTVHLISNALHRVLQDDALRQGLIAAPETVGLLVEEVLRHDSPVMMTKPLFATRDTTFEGQALKAGDQVAALLIGANHDPARHSEPAAFTADRRPNAHLGFGTGPHVCLGMQLARAEAQVAITTLLDRYPQAQLDGAAQRLRRVGLNGFSKLPVRLAPK
ncbi:Biotin biosynthesis cytochrome P450 [Flavimaricola marinus]|uniref:Biotin biosynthesis cytochrome P450 n=2 Tax=Flavimaricola marinus TaxID=1819565 RepID=A0A238LDQ8_9RHOB|nr:Biotin biosynthesis cytochrome P450 [Flavimaricola marinus]